VAYECIKADDSWHVIGIFIWRMGGQKSSSFCFRCRSWWEEFAWFWFYEYENWYM